MRTLIKILALLHESVKQRQINAKGAPNSSKKSCIIQYKLRSTKLSFWLPHVRLISSRHASVCLTWLRPYCPIYNNCRHCVYKFPTLPSLFFRDENLWPVLLYFVFWAFLFIDFIIRGCVKVSAFLLQNSDIQQTVAWSCLLLLSAFPLCLSLCLVILFFFFFLTLCLLVHGRAVLDGGGVERSEAEIFMIWERVFQRHRVALEGNSAPRRRRRAGREEDVDLEEECPLGYLRDHWRILIWMDYLIVLSLTPLSKVFSFFYFDHSYKYPVTPINI